jgi:uncharacterized protein (TIGR02246 family)
MAYESDPVDDTPFAALVHHLEAAWNGGDGMAFAEPFSEDADFVTIRGEHLRGRHAIGVGHAGIFRTIYAGSRNSYTIESSRLLRPDVALVHVHSVLDSPAGPLAGRHTARFSLVMTRDRGEWSIAALHNTLEPAARPAAEPAPIASKPETAEADLVRLAHEWDRAMVTNDPAAIGLFMADEWVIIGADGSVDSREKFLDLVRRGIVTHDVMESHDLDVRVHGDAAVVIARGVSGGRYHGQAFLLNERVSSVFVRRDGAWRCVSTHLSSLG